MKITAIGHAVRSEASAGRSCAHYAAGTVSRVRVLVGCLSLFLLAAPAVFAQTGTPPFGSFSGSSFDTVNNANLNVHLQIPIVSKAGRGMPFYYLLAYDNSLWSITYVNGTKTWVPAGGWGWSGITDDSTGYVQSESSFNQNQCFYNDEYYDYSYTQYYGFTYTDPSGTSHWFPMSLSSYPDPYPPDGCQPAPPAYNEQGTVTAQDGSGYTLSINLANYTAPATITDASGKVIIPPLDSTNVAASVTDSNGNKLSASTSGGTTTFTDTLGTTALTVSGSNPLTYSYTNPSGGTSQVTVNYSVYTVQTDFACSGVSDFGPTSESLIHTVTLADGTSYTFNYEQTPENPGNVTGRIASVTLPTGGTISYTYINGINNDGINCTTGAGAYLTRTASGGTWTYSVTGSAPSVTTVVDPQSNQTVYDFEGIYQTEEQIYQGSSTLLKTIYSCYATGTNSAPAPPCNGTAVSLPITQVATTTAWASGQESQTVTDYQSNGLPKETDEYGYGTNAVGPLVRKTITGYASLSNPNIQDRPSSITVEDGSGNHVAATAYTYDGNGNMTSLGEYFNPTTTVSRYFGYGSYGVLTSATDFNGNTTTFTNGDCSGAFPTSIAQPLSLSSAMTWDCGAGLVTSVTDPNSQTTRFSYDELDRVTQTNNPDGGGVSTQYNDASSPVTVESTTALGAPGNRQDVSVLDGLGRVTETQLASDPVAPDKVDTTYDLLGRVASVSNPYRSTSDPTYGKTQYSYDTLGRVTQVTEPDGDTQQEAYGVSATQTCSTSIYGIGYPTLTTDEDGYQKRLWSDALGRLIEVDEPDPANGNALDLPTCYDYDTLSDLVQVDVYDPHSNYHQTRTYSYDMLGRLISAATPESGTTTYSYSGCSGDPSNVCSRTDARGITTTYAYDALNRLLSKSYSDGTPTAYYYYDQTNTGVWGSPTLGNPKGRLTSAATKLSNGTIETANVYSYDPMGRIQTFWQCTPYNCGNSSIWQMTYSYDLAGDVASWTHPAGFTITNTINAAQQITQITSSLNDATHPGTLATISYTPWDAESTLENGCAGSGCTNTVETYAYNNRLQPVMIELGTPSNPSADYCLVYDYIGTPWEQPSSCSVTQWQGSINHGPVLSYYYQDNVNPSLSHTANFWYDELYRLTQAQASGNSKYFLDFDYDRYGNMTCTINGQTNGPCPEYSFNSANNRITNTGYTYDAAGDLTSDGTNTYQYDAEGREISVDGPSNWAVTYNALGQAVQRYYAPQGETDSFPRDPAGQFIANWSQNFGWWWDEFVRSGADGRLLADNRQAEDTTWLLHMDQIDSAKSVTTAAGQMMEDSLFYPWGSEWTYAGTGWGALFANMPICCGEVGQYVTSYRPYAISQGRWMGPDRLGGDITNPQSLNRYAYALNNPTTLTDPLGLDSCSVTYNPDGSVAANCTVTAQAPPPIPPSQYPGCVAYGSEGCIQPPCGELPGVVGCGGIIYTTSYGASGGGGSVSAPKPAPPALIGPAPPQTPTWWLQTKVFVSALGNNFVNEFKPNGCFAQFANELTGTGGSPPGVAPEDVIRNVGQAGAMSYAMAKGLSYPLKSSIYRGMLGLTETAAGIVTLAPLDYEEGKAFIHEMQSLGAGTCQ